MTIAQIEYFLEVAECKNISKAAERLYMTQPALSRQITAMEEELNMQLFLRKTRPISLTPAGQVFYDGLKGFVDNYKEVVDKAQAKASGWEGNLNFGILSGLDIGDFFPKLLEQFRENYPNIQLDVISASFAELQKGLQDMTLDFVLTYDFDIDTEEKNLNILPLEEFDNYIVMSTQHPFEEKESYSLSDFKEYKFIVNAPEDTPGGLEHTLEDCVKAGFTPNCKFASDLNQYMLLIEAGFGVSVLSARSTLRNKPNIRFLPSKELGRNRMILEWAKNNENPSISKGLKLFKKEFKL